MPLSASPASSFTTRQRRTIARLHALLDEYVGLIHAIDWRKPQPNEPQFIHCSATIADVSRFTGWDAEHLGRGTGLTSEEAQAKAIGDAVERYCADMYWPEEMVVATFKEIAKWAVDPRRFALFHQDQYGTPGFPFSPVTEDSKLVWAGGFSLSRNEPCWTPLSMIMQHRLSDQEVSFDVAPVSGYGCGLSLEDALLSGIYEVIARDSFMLHWYNRIPAPRVDLQRPISIRLTRILDRFRCAPVQLSCFDLTTDAGIPTYLAIMIGQETYWPAVVVATATDLDRERALEAALFELPANGLFVQSLFSTSTAQRPQRAADVHTREDHALFYADYRSLRHLKHLFAGESIQIKPVENRDREPASKLALIVNHLTELDFEVIYVDLTTADIDELGFKAVKVIIPGMQPLDFGMIVQHLGPARLYEAPARIGYHITNTNPRELNRFPQPFPKP